MMIKTHIVNIMTKENIEKIKEIEPVEETDKQIKEPVEDVEEILKDVKEIIKKSPEAEIIIKEKKEPVSSWNPKTKLGHEVKTGKIKNIDEILDSGRKILEVEIVDSLINLKTDLVSIGQSKGKFGGGKRRAWKQTQRKTKEGNIPTFSTMVVVGDEKGHVGVGLGRAKETLPARDKAIRKAKLNIFKTKRTCSGFDCSCSEPHTIPFKVTGKSGSVRVTLIPASQGTGLVVGSELKKILKLVGIKDVYSRTDGQKRTTSNMIKACVDALK